MSHTDAAEKRVLDWSTGNSTTAPTLPLMVRLMATMGSESAGGTQVSGGGYAPQSVAFGASTGDPATTSNTGLVRFDDMPGGSVAGFEVWDSAGTPFRWRTQAFGSSITFTAGDAAEFAAGSLILTES